jgi:hypothetical protein
VRNLAVNRSVIVVRLLATHGLDAEVDPRRLRPLGGCPDGIPFPSEIMLFNPSLDGWKYWQAKRPTDSDWIALATLRDRASADD